MTRLPSEDDFEFWADSALIQAIRTRDTGAVAKAVLSGAPFEQTAREIFALQFDSDEAYWGLKFHARRIGSSGATPKQRDLTARIRMKLRGVDPSKDKIEAVIAGVCEQHGVSRSKAYKIWSEVKGELAKIG